MQLAKTNSSRLRVKAYARPHPDPLPQERESHLPRFVHAKRSGFATCLSGSNQAAATATTEQPLGEGDASFTLSPGERAGVRASVDYAPKSISAFNESAATAITAQQITINGHPHPVLLPREKGNHLPRFADTERSGMASSLSTRDHAAATATAALPFNEGATSFTLSSGERAGVRASQTNQSIGSRAGHFTQNSLFSHAPRVCRQWMRRPFLQSVENRVANALPVLPQCRIPEAQLPDALRFQKPGSLGVMRPLPGMAVAKAVQFDREPRLHAEKIQRVFTERMFAPEFIAVKPAVTQPAPHELFGPGLLLPQRAGAVCAGHASTLSKEGRRQKIRVNVRPHPILLPQEKVNHLPRFVRRTVRVCLALFRNRPSSGNWNHDSGIQRKRRHVHPLPGGEGRGEGELIRDRPRSGDCNHCSTS